MSQSVEIKSLKMSNGIEFPMIGLGTFRSVGNDEGFIAAIKAAIKSGYRHFDLAWLYGNEDVVGKALKESIDESNGTLKREDLFLVSKVWNTHHSKEQVGVCLNETLTNLQVDYIDLYLVHWPMGFKEQTGSAFPKDENDKTIFSDVNYLETYKAMEELMKLGKIKSIGVSNFNIKQLEDVLANCEIKPVNNQVEVNPYLQNDELIEFCQKKQIVISCYGPIGAGQKSTSNPDIPIILENEVIVKIGKKYNKSPAQVCIRWGIQRNLVMLPKSVTPSRILENAQVFDFTLSDEDMLEMKGLNHNMRVYGVESLKSHKYYPF